MKKERKKGSLKAWFRDLKVQLERVETCFQENKKASLYYGLEIAILVVFYFIGGVALHHFFV